MRRAGPIDFSREVDLKEVDGKTALITGAADGIGFGVAEALAKNGAFVIIADINTNLGKRRQDELTSQGHKALFVHTDVTSWSSLSTAFKTAVQHSPTNTIHIVVTSAGLRGESVLPHIFPKDLGYDEDLPQPPTATMDLCTTLEFYKASEAASTKVAMITADGRTAGEDKEAIVDGHGVNEGKSDGQRANITNPIANAVKKDEIAIHNANGSKSDGMIHDTNGDMGHDASATTKNHDRNAYQLVYMASLSSYRGFASMSTYNAAKYGVRGLWKSIRNAPHGTYPFALRTNLVAPTITRTNMTADYFNAFVAAGGVATEVSDVVDVTMRVICDDTIDGRAVCALPDGKSFDLADDPRGGDGGKVVWEVSKKDGLGGKKIKAMTGYYEWFPENEDNI